MYNPSIEANDVLCPECHRVMVDLSDYAVAPDIGPGLDNGGQWYPGPVGAASADAALFEWVFESVGSFFHRLRLRRICHRELGEYPASLICPACLHLLRRR